MPKDYENSGDIADLSDEDLQRLVRDRLDQQHGVDPENVTISVRDGVVTLSGRVGTEAEQRIADHILSDAIGLTNYNNELVVDPIRRAESPEAVDDHRAIAE